MRKRLSKQKATVRAIVGLARELDKRKTVFYMFHFSEPFTSESRFCTSASPQITDETKEVVDSHLRNFRDPIKRLHILNTVADIINMVDDEGPDLEEAIRAMTDRNCRMSWPK